MLGLPRPQPAAQPKMNDVEKFDISDIYPQEDGSDMELSDHSESGRYGQESDGDDDESRYRMRSSRPTPAKRRKVEQYEEYTTDEDYDANGGW